MKLTEAQRRVLSCIADGDVIGIDALTAIYELEKSGLIEKVETGFLSQTHMRATPAGLAALKGSGNG